MNSAEKRITMFGGKGGVGKTTCAAATATKFTRAGQKTLVISTDPTPSLSDIFETKPSRGPTQVSNNLDIIEFQTDDIKEMWNRKFGHEVYEVFSSFVSIDYDSFVDFITSILPTIGEEFTVDYIRELSLTKVYDRIVWDTAPLGQTIKLLTTPNMLQEHLKIAPRIYSKIKLGRESNRPILDIIRGWSDLSGEDMNFLRNEVNFIMVTIPESLAVQQLDDAFFDFERQGLKFSQIIINNIIPASTSVFFSQKAHLQQKYIELIHKKYSDMEIIELPLSSIEIKGLARIEETGEILFSR
jgi:arsenite/tail-anchored protein-transporting ATPase